jgi:hypothetical protein
MAPMAHTYIVHKVPGPFRDLQKTGDQTLRRDLGIGVQMSFQFQNPKGGSWNFN